MYWVLAIIPAVTIYTFMIGLMHGFYYRKFKEYGWDKDTRVALSFLGTGLWPLSLVVFVLAHVFYVPATAGNRLPEWWKGRKTKQLDALAEAFKPKPEDMPEIVRNGLRLRYVEGVAQREMFDWARQQIPSLTLDQYKKLLDDARKS